MSLYLQKRDGTFYFRRAIPPALRRILGRSELTFSLRTKSHVEAKRRRTVAIASTDQILDEALKKSLGDSAPSKPHELSLQQRSFELPKLEAKPPSGATSDFGEWQRMLNAWQTDRKAVKKTQDTYLRIAKLFHEVVSKRPAEITKADVVKFKNHLTDVMNKSNANVHGILSKLRSLLNVGVANDMLEHNPALSVRITAEHKKRLPFSHDDLKAIFSGPVHTKGLRPTEGKGEAAFFVPPLLYMHGMRPGELAQIRLKDVQRLTTVDEDLKEYSWVFLHILSDEKDGLHIKNAPSERFVPLHPAAQEMGFIDYVQELRDANEYWLFPKMTPDKYGNRAAKFGEWFIEYLRGTCKVDDERKVLYSFRHTFKDLARNCGMPDELQRALMGHTGQGVASTYGSGFDLYRLAEAIKMVRLPGFNVRWRP